jgi:hypothetical protein
MRDFSSVVVVSRWGCRVRKLERGRRGRERYLWLWGVRGLAVPNGT